MKKGDPASFSTISLMDVCITFQEKTGHQNALKEKSKPARAGHSGQCSFWKPWVLHFVLLKNLLPAQILLQSEYAPSMKQFLLMALTFSTR